MEKQSLESETQKKALNAYLKLNRCLDAITARVTAESPFPDRLLAGQFGVLEALLHKGPMCQREICEKVLRSRGSMTFVVDRLERSGLVRRTGKAGDRRKNIVGLTPRGRALISGYFPLHARAIAGAMGVLDGKELLTLARLCKKLGLAQGGPRRAANDLS